MILNIRIDYEYLILDRRKKDSTMWNREIISLFHSHYNSRCGLAGLLGANGRLLRLLRQLCSLDWQSGSQVGGQRSSILGYGERVQTESFQKLGKPRRPSGTLVSDGCLVSWKLGEAQSAS